MSQAGGDASACRALARTHSYSPSYDVHAPTNFVPSVFYSTSTYILLGIYVQSTLNHTELPRGVCTSMTAVRCCPPYCSTRSISRKSQSTYSLSRRSALRPPLATPEALPDTRPLPTLNSRVAHDLKHIGPSPSWLVLLSRVPLM